jgi:hypothetical protein
VARVTVNSGNASTSPLDRACSASCTKSGIAALVFSAFAMSLMQPLMQIDAFNALSAYVGSRLTLKTALDVLDSDRCWQALRAEPGLEKRPLVRLKDRSCFYTADDKLITDTEASKSRRSPPVAPPPSTSQKNAPSSRAVPPPPSGLMVGGPPLAFDEIQQALSVLGQRETLRLAGSVFPFRFGWSIYWWQRRAEDLTKKTSPDHTIDDKNLHLDESLSIDDARILADFQFLNPSLVEQAVLDETRINLPNAKTSLTLGTSTNLVELAILLSVFYFWLYQQEARRSPTFPAPGTLFGVFSQSRTSLIVFHLLVAVPACCAVLLASRSLRYVRISNIALGVLVFVLCFQIRRMGTKPAPEPAVE